MKFQNIFQNLFDTATNNKDENTDETAHPIAKTTAAKVGLSTSEMQQIMLHDLPKLSRELAEPNAQIPLLFRSNHGNVIHTFYPVAIKAHWMAAYGIYDIELYADSANVRVFGDSARATSYILHIMLPRDVQTGTYEFYGKCGFADATDQPCIDIDVYNGVGDTKSGQIDITREGNQLTVKFVLVSYVDDAFEDVMNDTVTVSGTFEDITLPPPTS